MFLLIFYFYFSKLFALPELAETERSVFAIYSFLELILEILGIVSIILEKKIERT